ncbi:hypothetical protein FB451DRAFT_1393373 [Mycena latifolia]|nr:hypothetical protein FB451DRAFT_1393373 [Mycena latifolia]
MGTWCAPIKRSSAPINGARARCAASWSVDVPNQVVFIVVSNRLINPSALPGPAAAAPPSAPLVWGTATAAVTSPLFIAGPLPAASYARPPLPPCSCFQRDTWELPWLISGDYCTAPIAVVLIYGPAVPAAGMPPAARPPFPPSGSRALPSAFGVPAIAAPKLHPAVTCFWPLLALPRVSTRSF